MAKLPVSHLAMKVLECPKTWVLLKTSGRWSLIQRMLASEQDQRTTNWWERVKVAVRSWKKSAA